ncbi:DinB family protein [Planococcus sp. N028]|uniref:DinB family protein n=1 Tax=Planococcus shixiaomingii TaxID=3058393 RepID=A0ABT8N3U7_9BACL|nr:MULTISPECIES: DinB family protein [unclassified Planococcus (in: firmicutes)]MDN7242560.1 DinB family protein [Planococcus sp. N028]WKA54795.1 DinB family protein [Planococcus sp. N022]
MYRTLEDFLAHWRQESAMTLQVFEMLTDESLDQQITSQNRTLGRLGWHLTVTLDEMMGHTGLKFEAARFGSPVPNTAKEIADAYRVSSEAMIKAMQEQWTDATLQEERNMYGDNWTISQVLTTLVLHQTHHRGQMTVLMRQAGLKVPGLYGPAMEEWAAMGAPVPEV